MRPARPRSGRGAGQPSTRRDGAALVRVRRRERRVRRGAAARRRPRHGLLGRGHDLPPDALAERERPGGARGARPSRADGSRPSRPYERSERTRVFDRNRVALRPGRRDKAQTALCGRYGPAVRPVSGRSGRGLLLRPGSARDDVTQPDRDGGRTRRPQ